MSQATACDGNFYQIPIPGGETMLAPARGVTDLNRTDPRVNRLHED